MKDADWQRKQRGGATHPDPLVSEWGNPLVFDEYRRKVEGTGGTEAS